MFSYICIVKKFDTIFENNVGISPINQRTKIKYRSKLIILSFHFLFILQRKTYITYINKTKKPLSLKKKSSKIDNNNFIPFSRSIIPFNRISTRNNHNTIITVTFRMKSIMEKQERKGEEGVGAEEYEYRREGRPWRLRRRVPPTRPESHARERWLESEYGILSPVH